MSTSFIYDEAYLVSNDAFSIDPALPLQASASYTDGLPGVFRDSAPDRWGRHLISRRLRSQREDREAVRTLDDVDYLLGVHDAARQGALRYAQAGTSFRLAAESDVPPRIELPRLLAASNRIAAELGDVEDIKTLLDAGSGSLGGARPKASVVDGAQLLLAKFSHPGDEVHVMRWEHFALSMAAKVGLSVPVSYLVSIGSDDVLLLERFDRAGSLLQGRRLPYMSAMTLLQAQDGDFRDYAELAEAIVDAASDVEATLRDLFTRVVLYVALHNTDDHLRNMGLIRAGQAWKLSPCFDVNPNLDLSEPRVTGIYGETADGEIEGMCALAPLCGISDGDARRIVSRVVTEMISWQMVARKAGCPKAEISLFAPVFENRCSALAAAFC